MLAPRGHRVPEDTDLERELGRWKATAIGLGTMIGGGIFVLPGIAAEQAGPASAISFAIGGCVSFLTALAVAELATAFPRSGGGFYYVDHALGHFVGAIVGIIMWVGIVFAIAFYCVGFAQYLTFFDEGVPIRVVAGVLAVLLVGLNYHGASETGALQEVIVYSLVGLILVFIATGTPAASTERLRPFNPEGTSAVVATTGTVYVTFIGFQVIATAGSEIKRPSRNLPLAMLISVVVPTLLYVAVMLVSTGVLPVEELATSSIPVADVASELFGYVGGLLMVVGAVLATASSANASILSAGRISFAMGGQVLTPWMAKVHEEHRTPHRALAITGGAALALIAFNVGLATLAEVAGFLYLIVYGLVHVAMIHYRHAGERAYHPSFRLPSPVYPIVPIVGILSSFLVMTQMPGIVVVMGLGVIALAVLWYAAYVRPHHVKL